MGAVPTVSLEALTAAAREENRHAARKITACYTVHCDWITRDTKHKHYSRYGRTEMAVALGCSATVAESYVSVGVALHTRLPLLRAAFETGEIDLPRVRTACRILDNLSDAIVKRVEAEVVEAARRSSPGPLEQAIWDILLRVAPEEAAALREFAKKFRTVTYSPGGELARIRAELTAPEAAAAWQLLEEMADTLCPKDPRGKKERLCDAFMARMHGEPRLACLCHREDCPKKDAVLPDRRVPLTMITVDIATLIGLLTNPAYLAGHGSIDPDLARELSRNSHWQILLTEAITLAESLGLAHQDPETGEWERTPKNHKQESASGSDPANDTDTKSETNAASATDEPATRDDTDPAQGNESESCTTTDTSADADTAATGTGTGTATDATAVPKAEPTHESATSGGHATESTTAPSPDPAPTSAAAKATATAADSASGKETDPGRGSDPAPSHAASARGPVDTSSSTPDPTAESHRTPDAAQAPASAPMPNTASGQTETHTAPDQPEHTRTVTPTPGPPPTTSPTQGTAPASEPGTTASPAPLEGQTGDTSAHSTADTPPPDTGGGEDRPRRTQSLTSAAALFCTHTPVGRGTRHSSALDLPTLNRTALNQSGLGRSGNRGSCTASGIYLGNASLAAALEAAIAADPTLGTSVARDPLTDRVLIYRPDTLTTAAVRLRDKHCRFPGCHRPAARCQLDHITPFDHTNPLGGGWTTVNNLQCLCEYHHSVKTAGYWTATMLPGGAILWTSTSKTTRITLPTNGTAIPILGNDLTPHIPTRPKRSGIIAYPDPPDNRQPETDDTATPPF
ncbi:hypothetical protein CH272_17500 [Rhodococcus sp. 05-340-1]|uniref:HNH endonuclease signature motif containing protein n=1 Tax=unclassified Rhodococcus (in: high G+C Gram-positive bacteria) TaxID=192944 RepID=UPI000B9BDC45|nr:MULTISPECIES: HNH endonuclease signature motif containing protein [unclassified Rhodococcus (in: high G+C Gram-positive bacteria)]OZD63513.1 hypothetical protein CH271_23110 [Rhodococcus sp. 05-340-2]OZD75555.1 hypothetical protein CH272_17500 [Rhodococcus sp. 05-340-1]